MKETLYSTSQNRVIGFHGCDSRIINDIISGKEILNVSKNNYDWLGHGIYFGENNESRALQYATEMLSRKKSKSKPAIIGAVIDLGYCLDLTDSYYLDELKEAYKTLVDTCKLNGNSLPKNTDVGKSNDKLLRRLDCAVIETEHLINIETGDLPFDSVKGVFWEGDPLYPGAGFAEKNHIQICIRNPNCIKGFFLPREIDSNYTNP